MRPPTHYRFVDKAAAAITSAVEVYNKPAFAYREETFAILALNAWELLLKAKLLKDAGNRLNALRVYESRKLKSGAQSTKLYLKKNRAGNPLSIAIGRCIAVLRESASRLPTEVEVNLDALTAIRDNSVHFITASQVLARQAQELGSASVKNFVILAREWFRRDLSSELHLILPLSFIAPANDIESVVVSADENRLIEYLKFLATSSPTDEDSQFAIAVRFQLKIEKSKLSTAAKVQVSKDPDAVKITLSEEDIHDKYPWDYGELCTRLKARYKDFKLDKAFHKLKKPLLSDERFAKRRFLHPGNPKSPKKDFYNSNVFGEFDRHYTKK